MTLTPETILSEFYKKFQYRDAGMIGETRLLLLIGYLNLNILNEYQYNVRAKLYTHIFRTSKNPKLEFIFNDIDWAKAIKLHVVKRIFSSRDEFLKSVVIRAATPAGKDGCPWC